jgi:hypothetical protein
MIEIVYIAIGLIIGLSVGVLISFTGQMAYIQKLKNSIKQQSKTIDELAQHNDMDDVEDEIDKVKKDLNQNCIYKDVITAADEFSKQIGKSVYGDDINNLIDKT